MCSICSYLEDWHRYHTRLQSFACFCISGQMAKIKCRICRYRRRLALKENNEYDMQKFERLEHAATTCVACNSDAGETEDPAILMSSTEKRDQRPASAVAAQFSQEQYGNCYDACLYLQRLSASCCMKSPGPKKEKT